ncbi:MAG: hypothetical protein ACE5ER_05170 [Nitrospinaceae bacterium]
MKPLSLAFLSLIPVIAGLGLLPGLAGCGQTPAFEEYFHSGGVGEKARFDADSALCQKEKNKHSHKIQGREFGFSGPETGYHACMKLKGWERKKDA